MLKRCRCVSLKMWILAPLLRRFRQSCAAEIDILATLSISFRHLLDKSLLSSRSTSLRGATLPPYMKSSQSCMKTRRGCVSVNLGDIQGRQYLFIKGLLWSVPCRAVPCRAVPRRPRRAAATAKDSSRRDVCRATPRHATLILDSMDSFYFT